MRRLLRKLAPAALLFVFFLCSLPWLYLLGCGGDPITQPPTEPELHGFIVKRCGSKECLKDLLKTLSEKTGCAVLSISTTYEAGYKAISGLYTYTVIAECPEEPVKSVCDGGGNG